MNTTTFLKPYYLIYSKLNKVIRSVNPVNYFSTKVETQKIRFQKCKLIMKHAKIFVII